MTARSYLNCPLHILIQLWYNHSCQGFDQNQGSHAKEPPEGAILRGFILCLLALAAAVLDWTAARLFYCCTPEI